MYMNLKEYPKVFLHGLDLTNWYLCHNISLDGTIWSPNFVFPDNNVQKFHTNLRDIPLNDLRNNRIPANFAIPRVKNYFFKGLKILTGIESNLIKLSELNDDEKYYLKIAEMELTFEEERRKISPDSASRLSCLWVAENSEKGKEQIIKMLDPDKMLSSKLLIIQVKLEKILRLTKVDIKWFDEYFENKKKEFVENYWKGIPFSESEASWEYLVEGIIKINNGQDLDYIRSNGQKIPGFLSKHFKT